MDSIAGDGATSSNPADISISPDPSRTMALHRRETRNVLSFLRSRETGSASSIHSRLMTWIEGRSLEHLDKGQYLTPAQNELPLSAITSMAFSHNGEFFVSTHGDRSVRVFCYPSGKQIACLEGHLSTPVTVCFHPRTASIVASGCIAGDCCIWNISTGRCIRKHAFLEFVYSICFSPDGTLLAVALENTLMIWEYNRGTKNGTPDTSTEMDGTHCPGLPRELLQLDQIIEKVTFHCSGKLILTSERSYLGHHRSTKVRLVLYRFDDRVQKIAGEPALVIRHVIRAFDTIVDMSPCGTMLATCVSSPNGDTNDSLIAIFSLIAKRDVHIGDILYQSPLNNDRVEDLTGLKFSSTSNHLLAGYSFTGRSLVLFGYTEQQQTGPLGTAGPNVIPGVPPAQVSVVDIYRISDTFQVIRSLSEDVEVIGGPVGRITVDGAMIAIFASGKGASDGVVYGTWKGRIRLFRPETGHI